ncbi:protein teashirt-like [Ischnura elegans]|uniref:protein teashirt-like n=1 Tax=Ischnura elegans TaxID=197161 RepID=UPI001ED88980|nr:protein teashirt-like [Ischnura elegans]
MPRKKQHCPKRMKWEGEGEGPPRSPSQQDQQSGSSNDEDEEASDQSQDEEEDQSQGTTLAPAEVDGDSEKVAQRRQTEEAAEEGEGVGDRGESESPEAAAASGADVKSASGDNQESKPELEKVLNLNKEGERMLGPEALVTRDQNSPRGGATVPSQPNTPSPSPPATSPSLATPLLAAQQIQPIIDLHRTPHVLPPGHHQPIPLHPTAAAMLGPAAAILPPSAAILSPSAAILATPPAAVMLNPTTAAALLGSAPGVLSTSRSVVQSEPGSGGNAEILDFSTKGRKRGRRRDGGRDSGEDGESEEEGESDMDQDESIEEEGGVLNLSKPTTPQVSTLDLSSPLDLSVNRRKRQRLASSEDVSISTVPGTASQTPQNLHVGVGTPTTSMSPLASLASSIASHLLPHRRGSQSGRSEAFKQPPTPWSAAANPVPPGQNLPYPFYQTSKSAQTHHHHHTPPTTQHQSNSLRQSSPDPWNGKVKGSMSGSPGYSLASSVAPSDATKALEKMSELSKLGSDSVREDAAALSYLRQHQGGAGGAGGGSVSSRQSAWQSHWLSKGAEQARDVLKCVWCRQSFQSLSALTVHMKEAKHCGVQGMPQGQVPVSVAISTSQSTQQSPSMVQSTSNISGNTGGSQGGSGNTASSGNQQGGKDLSLLIKETMPLPRKLVRGQDVWLGKGAEQTRQILKCMWCGQSFRSLAEMTSHMQQTQHYTNIVSQEQIISWKSADDRGGSGGAGGAAGGGATGGSTGGNSTNSTTGGSSGNAASQGGHVTAVLTCKVCDEAFGSLKELSNHMVKNAHYKEHIMRSITEGGAAGQLGNSGQARRRAGSGTGNNASAMAAREKRKKSLPVRKLLELERAQNELKNGGGDGKGSNMAMLGSAGGGRITCEKCGERIETAMFVEHIRQCVGGSVASLTHQRNLLKSALMSEVQEAATAAAAAAAGARTPDGNSLPPPQRPGSKLSTPDKSDNTASSKSDMPLGSGLPGSSPSVLNAIEKLIEKSFDSRMRQGYAGGVGGGQSGNVAAGSQPIGSSILKRLGIDETVDYTKPLVDPHTMNLLRGYHAYGQFGGLLNPVTQGGAGKRERSGSESSSVSDRCGGGGSVTPPDRRQKSLTPRSTPEAIQTSPVSTPTAVNLANSTPPTSQPATPMAGDEKRDKKEDVVSSEDEHDKEGSVTASGEVDRVADSDDANQDAKDAGKTVDGRDAEREGDPEVKKEDDEEAASDRDPEDGQPDGDVDETADKTSEDKEERASKSSKTDEKAKIEVKLEDVKVEDDGEKDDDSSKGSPKAQAAGSLGALSSMFDSLSGDTAGGSQAASSGSATGVTTSHPLAALQKLCDKTESHHNHAGSAGHQSVLARSPSVGSTSSTLNANYPSSSNTSPSNPGAILAFSWACNDAVVSDSLLKCAFCETPFVSKGAYRHHLSKMHFVKDGQLPEPSPAGSGGGSQGAQEVGSANSSGRNEVSSPKTQGSAGGSTVQEARSPQLSTTPPGTSSSDESPHSKFLKYTELAKQLSSKYV